MAAVCVFTSASRTLDPRWLDLATEVGRQLGRRGHSLVSGGGRVGMMGAVADGARAAGAHTCGVIPRTLVDREIADRAADELIVTEGMLDRKALLIDRAEAFLTIPGGIGTLDELFEVWTTAMMGLHTKPIVLLDADGFYTPLVGWLGGLAEPGFVRAGALDRLTVAPDVDAALDAIDRGLAWTR